MWPEDDRVLLGRTATDDHIAFGTLYDRHAEAVARYVTARQKASDVHLVDS